MILSSTMRGAGAARVHPAPGEPDPLLAFSGIARFGQTDISERKDLFEALMVDLGEVSAAYSDRREDWYGDDGRQARIHRYQHFAAGNHHAVSVPRSGEKTG